METNFFSGCVKLEMVRPRYKELALQFHPDRGGDTRTMQIINDQYHRLLKSFEGSKLFNHKTKEEYFYRYDFTAESALMDKINEVIKLKLENITLEVIGSWLWIHNTSKEQSKLFGKAGLGFKFSGQHVAWFWHQNINRTYRGRSGMSIDQIRSTYGSDVVEHERNIQM